MKILKITLTLILIYVAFILGLKIYHNYKISNDIKREERNKVKKSAEVLNKCFDLKNKSQRNIHDSIKLIEYCLKEYGYGK